MELYVYICYGLLHGMDTAKEGFKGWDIRKCFDDIGIKHRVNQLSSMLVRTRLEVGKVVSIV